MRPVRFGIALATAAGAALAPRVTQAEPQWNAGAVTAACLRGSNDEVFESAAFCGGFRGDILFGRSGTQDLGVGPMVGVGTAAFDDLRLTLGGSALLPVLEDFPVVVSLGGLVRDAGDLGAEASLFWGVRSYNFHSAWNFAAGLSLGAQRTFGDEPDNVLWLGLQIDGLVFALPVLLLVGALE